MKATVRIEKRGEFIVEFPHDVCIEEEFVFNDERLVIIDIYLEGASKKPTDFNPSNGRVIFHHVVVCEPADSGE